MPDVVGTIGMLNVPNGSINVVPGRCLFSLDRATRRTKRDDALAADVLAELKASASAAACSTRSRRPCACRRAQRACVAAALGSAPSRRSACRCSACPAAPGHDAMKLHEVMPQAMLFVRGLNAGISHNPLESTTNDDADLSVRPSHLLGQLDEELS